MATLDKSRNKIFLVIFILLLLLAGAVFYSRSGKNFEPFSLLEEQKIESREEDKLGLPEKVFIENVPFTTQAPFADWEDDRQQDGCEEASVLMAIRWIRGQGITKQEALDEILAMSAYELEKYGSYHDTSAED